LEACLHAVLLVLRSRFFFVFFCFFASLYCPVMVVARPRINTPIDTLDLQHRDTPSAQDHGNPPSSPTATVNGYGASQTEAIRNVTEEQAQAGYGHQKRMAQHESDGLLADAGVTGDDSSFDDDDMMDKMSSSPSIADGVEPPLIF
jgi:hypothetical protein